MILAVRLPDGITCHHVAALVTWIRERGTKLRPWLETYAAAEAARDGIEVPEGAVPAIFEEVMRALDTLMGWPEMAATTADGARSWYASEASRDS